MLIREYVCFKFEIPHMRYDTNICFIYIYYTFSLFRAYKNCI